MLNEDPPGNLACSFAVGAQRDWAEGQAVGELEQLRLWWIVKNKSGEAPFPVFP
jgi:hypothetical protein